MNLSDFLSPIEIINAQQLLARRGAQIEEQRQAALAEVESRFALLQQQAGREVLITVLGLSQPTAPPSPSDQAPITTVSTTSPVAAASAEPAAIIEEAAVADLPVEVDLEPEKVDKLSNDSLPSLSSPEPLPGQPAAAHFEEMIEEEETPQEIDASPEEATGEGLAPETGSIEEAPALDPEQAPATDCAPAPAAESVPPTQEPEVLPTAIPKGCMGSEDAARFLGMTVAAFRDLVKVGSIQPTGRYAYRGKLTAAYYSRLDLLAFEKALADPEGRTGSQERTPKPKEVEPAPSSPGSVQSLPVAAEEPSFKARYEAARTALREGLKLSYYLGRGGFLLAYRQVDDSWCHAPKGPLEPGWKMVLACDVIEGKYVVSQPMGSASGIAGDIGRRLREEWQRENPPKKGWGA